MNVIEVNELRKHFSQRVRGEGRMAALRSYFSAKQREIKAVDGVSFSVRPGEIIGYLGPNGAGKSTTIKMLTGLLVPTSGSIVVNGRTPWRERTKHVAGLGVVFGQRSTLWYDLPVIESLRLLKHLYRIPKNRFEENLDLFRRLLDLDPFLDSPVRSLSLGQRMRADLCGSLLHDPKILLLDEPTIGLDVVAKERIRSFIKYLNEERGTTVLLTTHDLVDIERLCHRVMIIDHGKLLFDGALGSLKERFAHHRDLILELSEPVVNLPVIQGAELVEQKDFSVTYRFLRAGTNPATLITDIVRHLPVQDMTIKEPDIENLIREIYEFDLLRNDRRSSAG